jgi:hypothetical protein
MHSEILAKPSNTFKIKPIPTEIEDRHHKPNIIIQTLETSKGGESDIGDEILVEQEILDTEPI